MVFSDRDYRAVFAASPDAMPASGQPHVIGTVRDITGWKRMRQLSRMMVTAAENERKSLSPESRAR